MIKDAGAGYVIIGHSERRRLFGDTDESVNRKLVAALAADLTPIVCIGETLEERDANRTLAVLDRQIEAGARRAHAGAGRLAGHRLRAGLGHRHRPQRHARPGRRGARAHPGPARRGFGQEAADACHVLYGGSVKPDNIKDLMALEDVDGALVGGASLTVPSFFAIVTGSREFCIIDGCSTIC